VSFVARRKNRFLVPCIVVGVFRNFCGGRCSPALSHTTSQWERATTAVMDLWRFDSKPFFYAKCLFLDFGKRRISETQ